VQVGPTAKGRKGTGWSPIKYLFSMIDGEWSKNRIKTGLSTGEGLIFNVRDPIYKTEPVREGKKIIDYQQVMVDPGEDDKRLLVIEPEFASTLTVMAREGNTLSAVMRQGWDDRDLSPLTRNNPIKATDAHVSIIGHITQQELLARMDDTSKANGFANRFLWAVVKRSKELPEGAEVPADGLEKLAEKLTTAVNRSQGRNCETRRSSARGMGASLRTAECRQTRIDRRHTVTRRSASLTVERSLCAARLYLGGFNPALAGRSSRLEVLRGVGAIYLRCEAGRPNTGQDSRSAPPGGRCRADEYRDSRIVRPEPVGNRNRQRGLTARRTTACEERVNRDEWTCENYMVRYELNEKNEKGRGLIR